MNRQTLTKIHMLLAAFILPVAVMFLVTGGLYTWGVKGSYESTAYDIALSAPLTDDSAKLQELTEAELARLSVAFPSGKAKVKHIGTAFLLEWTGSARDVVLETTADPLLATLTVKETNWYRVFVQLHKAKGGVLFKVYAAVLATSLFVILLSGFLMAWQVPKYRKLAAGCAVSGLGIFILVVAAS
jgi:hypothetical protein